MGGWFADIFIEYLFRACVRGIGLIRSHGWPTETGTVMSATCQRAGYGCTVATVYYEYPVDGEILGAAFEKPFISHDSGVEYAAKFVKGTNFRVRLKPGDPSTSMPCG
jgi:hypothetical protein